MLKTKEYLEGKKACEAGKSLGDNPYFRDGTQLQIIDWRIGFEARADRGFDTSHLPRKPCSDAFAL